MSIVKVTEDKKLVVSVMDIASNAGLEPTAIMQNINKHKSKFRELGLTSVSFKIFKILKLTEEQTMFLLSLMRNNDFIVDFKFNLVKEFFRMRELLTSGTAIPKEMRVMYDTFVPKSGFNEQNKDGYLKTKPVRGYFKVDKNDEHTMLLSRRLQLVQLSGALFQEEINAEIELIEQQIEELK